MKTLGIHSKPFINALSTSYARTRSQHTIDQIEASLREHEQRLIQMNQSYATLQARFLELDELRHVLRETQIFFDTSSTATNFDDHPDCKLTKNKRMIKCEN